MKTINSILFFVLAILVIKCYADDSAEVKLVKEKMKDGQLDLTALTEDDMKKICADEAACNMLIEKATPSSVESKKDLAVKHVCGSAAYSAYMKKEAKDRPNSASWEKVCKEEEKKEATKKPEVAKKADDAKPNEGKKEEEGNWFVRNWIWLIAAGVGFLVVAFAIYFFVMRD